MRLESIRASYFADGETEKMWTRRHIAVLLPPFLVTGVVAVTASRLHALSNPERGSGALANVLAWIVFAFVLRFLFKMLWWWYDVIFVTDRRIFEVKGLVPQNVYSMPLWKVTDMTYRRTALGFVFGYGALILETAGQDQALEHMDYLPDSVAFYKAVNSQGSTFESHSGGRDDPPPPPGGGGAGPDDGPGADFDSLDDDPEDDFDPVERSVPRAGPGERFDTPQMGS